MRAGLVFILISLVAGGAFREWRRSHENRLREFVASLESPEGEDAPVVEPRGSSPRRADTLLARPGGPEAGGTLRPGRLDPDRADASDWERLPGIGPALARRIVSDREARGPFAGPEALLRVPGIGPRTLERIRPYLRAKPVAADSGAAN
jgi:competence ComEA-like helix-hairpin-helix protein